ncbi:MAG: phosphonate metabolism protein/1,5-bisphosphokinase (PRPP-forming) PhnN [Paracoccaceae bacterium]|nr:phosphonate metabolism protein/1,5-bisphosphokinase (PRPP-forming) PhnN [Rhodobacterales bacterium LSUCC0374]MBF9039379.1 phosphonate metabolism protein/1,5-bisphosphokinase (PRPP-forming) PhnN [Rhodobacterales bacterium LSUCC0387]
MRTGRLIAVVGPSGVGKDSVMAGLMARHPDLRAAKRVITRPSDAGGEAFDGVSTDEFSRLMGQGAFALSWQAHGLSYGIPAEVAHWITAGHDVLANLSRNVLSEAAVRFARVVVLSITASPAVLATRLNARGREDAQDIVARLARQVPLPTGLNVVEIDNSGTLEATIAAAEAGLFKG